MPDPIYATLRLRDAIADPTSVPAREITSIVRQIAGSRGIDAEAIEAVEANYHWAVFDASESAARRLVAGLFRSDAILTLRAPLGEGQAPCEVRIEQDGQIFLASAHRISLAMVSAALGRLA